MSLNGRRSPSASDVLRQYGFIQPWHVRYRLLLSLGALLVAPVAMAVIAERFWSPLSGKDAATFATTVVAFIVAFTQWSAARQETSLDKYYDRRDVANRRFKDWYTNKDSKRSHEDIDHRLYDEYVIGELDLFSYSMKKYVLGYMKDDHAYDCLVAFKELFKWKMVHDSAWAALSRIHFDRRTREAVVIIRKEVSPTITSESIVSTS